VQFSLSVKDSLGTGLGGANGSLKDTGTNPFFPRGVKMSFRNGLSVGMGWDCTDGVIDGPSRLVHGATSTSTPIDDLCTNYADPRLWFGLVTYSSDDPRYYPNQGFPPCDTYYQEYLTMFLSMWGGFGAPLPRSASSSGSGNISGFGLATVIDTNYNRNYDRGDRFAFVPVCGPYTHLDGSAILPGTASAAAADVLGAAPQLQVFERMRSVVTPKDVIYPSDPDDYNYIACGGFDEVLTPSLPGGVFPSQLIDENPYIALELSALCAFTSPGTKGDLKIGIGTRITTTTSTTVSTVAPPP
jgi:hypothetical protein